MNTISNNNIARAIYLAHKDGAKPRDILQFLARRRLLSRSKEILISLQNIINVASGTVEVKVETARGLSSNTKKEIENKLAKRYNAKKIVLKEEIRPELLGEFRLEALDEAIDFTFRNQINKLKEYLIK